jgi:DnaJ domain
VDNKSNNYLYAKLGLSRGASPEAIKHAYHTLAKAYHPDGAAADEVMEQAFAEIAVAASILRDPKMRSLYDRGYINNFGDFTSVGRERQRRRRERQVFGSVLVFSFLAALPIVYWGLTGKQETPRVRVEQKNAQAQPQPHDHATVSAPNPTNVALTPEKRSQLTNAEPAPIEPLPTKRATNVPAEEASAVTASRDDHEYLPLMEREKVAAERSIMPPKPLPHKTEQPPVIREVLKKPQYQQTLPNQPSEGKKTVGMARLTPPRTSAEDIGSGFREPGFRKQALEGSSTVRTAACLACLTKPNGICAEICP